MPPVKQNWRLIAETALKDAASANARLTAANHALDGFRAEVAAALTELQKSLPPTMFSSVIYTEVQQAIDATMTALGLGAKEGE